MKTTTGTDSERNLGDNSSPAVALADRLVWRVSVTLLSGMGVVLLLLWDRSTSLAVLGGTGSLWWLCTGFIHYFFRDPAPDVPPTPNIFVSPAHGLVDLVDETIEPEFMGGPCRRVSVFLSVLDVHVQNVPVAGRVSFVRHQPGEFLNAMRTESARHNENQLIGIESQEVLGERVVVRQIAGFIARRVVTWVKKGETVTRGQRLGLIQFGSRCDLYLPLTTQITIKPGEKVVGGQTVVATRPVVGAEVGKPGSRRERTSQLL
jgi:phosphatidylserine decarboxylase